MVESADRKWSSPASLRRVPLLEGERVEQAFSPKDGLTGNSADAGPLLVLTDRRLVVFTDEDGHRETTVMPLESVGAARVKISGRSAKPLTQGLALVLVGVIAYLALGTFVVEGLPVPLAVGGGIMLVGLLFILRYVFWEEEGSLGFQAGNWELEFPFSTAKAGTDAYTVLEGYFRARAAVTLPHALSAAGVSPAPEAGPGPVPATETPAAAMTPPVLAQEPPSAHSSAPPEGEAPTASGPQPVGTQPSEAPEDTARSTEEPAPPPPAWSREAAAMQDETAMTATQPSPAPLEPSPAAAAQDETAATALPPDAYPQKSPAPAEAGQDETAATAAPPQPEQEKAPPAQGDEREKPPQP